MQILSYLWHFIEKSGQIPGVPEGPDTYTGRFIRVPLFSFPGLSSPKPFRCITRMIMADIDPIAPAEKGPGLRDTYN
jgi:hypothetical protein